jgi:hypothetical protein
MFRSIEALNLCHRITEPAERTSKKGHRLCSAYCYFREDESLRAALQCLGSGQSHMVHMPGLESGLQVQVFERQVSSVCIPSSLFEDVSWRQQVINELQSARFITTTTRFKSYGLQCRMEAHGPQHARAVAFVAEMVHEHTLWVGGKERDPRVNGDIGDVWRAELRGKFDEIQRDHKTLVKISPRAPCIRVYSPSAEIRDAVVHVLLEIVNRNAERTIAANTLGALMVVRRKIMTLKNEHPKLRFVLRSDRVTVTVSGNRTEVDIATVKIQQMLAEDVSRVASSTDTALAADECPICLCPIDAQRVALGCGHSYCATCAWDLVVNASSVDYEAAPIACADAACKATGCTRCPWSLQELRLVSNLNSQTDETEASKLCDGIPEAFLLARLQAHLSPQPHTVLCPNANCRNFLILPPEAQRSHVRRLRCGSCNACACERCGMETVDKDHVCDDLKRKVAQDEFDCRNMPNYMRCRCGTPLERKEGCKFLDHKCGASMCIECKRFLPSSHAAHECTVSGYAFL